MPPRRKQPLDFRQKEVEYVMRRWKAASSVSLVGIGSVGKSNLIQHLADSEVQKHFMGDIDPTRFKAVIIDPNMLGAMPTEGSDAEQFRCWAGYELMLHRLYMAFYPFDVLGPDDAKRFYQTYQTLQDGTNPLYAYMGLRYFELGVEFFMRHDVQIVFMFDEFEEMLQRLPVKFFQTLRGIRDANKNSISYMTFSRSPLSTLVERYKISVLDIEPFVELFSDNFLYVGPYSEVDAQRMVNSLMDRNEKQFSDEVIRFLMDSSGRFAGLLRAGFHALDAFSGRSVPASQFDQYTQQIAAKPAVRSECRTIWMSLNQSERYVLKTVARLTPYHRTDETEDAVTMLVQKKLLMVDRARDTLEINPPMFRAFVASNPDEA
jgi:hypothetical protein